MRLVLVPALCLFLTPAHANDGFGGIAATGLTFGQTEAVTMAEEELFISPDTIRVDYVFRNDSTQDVTGEVIFPMPPIPVEATAYSDWNLPEDRDAADLVDFRATVDGRDQPVTLDRIAVIEPSWDENAPLSRQYDTPGTDVTAELAALGLPLTVDHDKAAAALLALSPERRGQAVAAGLAEFYPAADGMPEQAVVLWSVLARYHWTQTFPAGQELRISHSYRNRPPGGIFVWSHPAPDYMQDVTARYCIDEGTSKVIAKRLANPQAGEEDAVGMAYYISYVLRTANSWAGPIGRFRLTLDKGAAENVISLCAEGVEKTGPTTFVVEKTDYSPERDLEILIVAPMATE